MIRGESPDQQACITTATPISALAAWCGRVNERLPLLRFLGFAFWVAWFGVAYSTSSWLSDGEPNITPVYQMFNVSTLAHMVGLGLMALLALRFKGLIGRRWLVGLSGGVATLGCLLIVLASPDYGQPLPLWAFYVAAALTGFGTATLGINSGLQLCTQSPARALRVLLIAELVAACIQLMAAGLSPVFARIIFITLPLLSTACFLVGSFAPCAATAREESRLRPSGTFGRFLFAIFVLSVAAQMGRGIYSSLATPGALAFDGALGTFALIAILAVLLVGLAGARRMPHFARWFYLMAAFIMVAMLTMILWPDNVSFGLVLSNVTFQLFDVATWYAFAYIVFESKVSAVLVVALGRMTIALGVTVGNMAGGACIAPDGTLLPMASYLFIGLFAAVLMVFLLLSERQIERLLLPIPDEDLGWEETSATPSASTPVAADTAPSANATTTGETASSANVARVVPASTGTNHHPQPTHNHTPHPEDETDNPHSSSQTPSAPAVDSPIFGTSSGRGRWKAQALALGQQHGLTDRELEVFLMLARGRGTQSISDELTISLYTTRAHTRNIYTKLDVHSRQQLIDKVNAHAKTNA